MHVRQETIQDYKFAGFGIIEIFPDFSVKKSEKWRGQSWGHSM
jgi:hypothetical protein